MKFRLHVMGLPHTVTSKEYTACAYTQKVLKLCAMMRKLGHHVIHYGNEASVVDCDEHVTVTTRYDLEVTYPGFDYRKTTFRFDVEKDHVYRAFYANAIREIGIRKQPLDVLLCMWGAGHKPVADAHPDMIAIEPGIGYAGGHFARWRVWESYAIMHAFCGLHRVSDASNPPWYDVVIPNFFDPADFTFSDRKCDYFLALGRVDTGKGVHIAIQACEKLGSKLVIAGQGDPCEKLGYPVLPSCVEFVGHADVKQRRRLMAGARGLFALTQYVEPFGGVAVEAMLSGTPIICTDWGAFTETVPHGVTGFRCRTFADILSAMRNLDRIIPANCRDWAMNYTCDAIAPRYDRYFHDVYDVHAGAGGGRPAGWYAEHPDRLRDIGCMEMPMPSMRRRFQEAAE